MQNTLRIFFDIRQSERELLTTKEHESERRVQIVEHFNFLNLLAGLHNAKLLTKYAADICEDNLLNHIAVLELNDWARENWQRAVTSSNAFIELADFYKQHREEIRRRRDEILRSQQQDYSLGQAGPNL